MNIKLQLSLYRKLLFAFLLIGILPSAIGFYVTYLGTKDVIKQHFGFQLLTNVERYGQRADEIINNIGLSADKLFNEKVIRVLVQTINESQPDSVLDNLSQTDEQASRKFKLALEYLIKDHLVLNQLPGFVIHRRYTEPLYANKPERIEDLNDFLNQYPDILNHPVRWDLFDRLDINTGTPKIGFIYGIDAPSLKESNLIYFCLVDPETIFPFVKTEQLAEQQGFAILSNRGYNVYMSGSLEIPRSQYYRNQILEKDIMSGFYELESIDLNEETNEMEHRITAFQHLFSLRRKLNNLELDADWIFCLMGDTADTETNLGWLYWRVWLINGGLILFIGILCLGITNKLVKPLIRLNKAAQLVSRGEFESRVPVMSRDEVGSLAKSFNEMAAKLEQSYKDLRQSLSEVRMQAQQLSILQDITNATNTQLEVEKMLALAMLDVKKMFHYDIASINLYNPVQKTVTVQLMIPEVDEYLFRKGQTYTIENTNRQWVIENPKSLIKEISEEMDDIKNDDTTLIKLGIRSIIILPLLSSDEVIGTMGIGSKSSNQFDQSKQEVLEKLANSLAVMITHNRLYRQVMEFAEEMEQKVEERTEQLADAQSKLVQAEKFAATGRLSGTVAHEINNPLGIIKNYLNLLVSQVEDSEGGRRKTDPNMDHLKIIQEELDRIARIVKSLMDFYRPAPQQNVLTDLQLICDQILALLEKDWEKKNITVVTHFLEELPMTSLSPDLMRQIFMNLFRNAEDAMENGGQLTIRFSLEPEIRKGRDGEVIRIDVIDTGCGIPMEIQSRIFEPFYTTKKEGKRDWTGPQRHIWNHSSIGWRSRSKE